MNTIDGLREALIKADYTTDAVLERIGEAGQEGLHRNCTIPARDALRGDDSPLATLIKLFPLNRTVDAGQAKAALPVEALITEGLLEPVGDDQVRATVDLRPYGFEIGSDQASDGRHKLAGDQEIGDANYTRQWDGWVVSDPTPGLDYQTTPTKPDYVLGVSPASTTLAQLTIGTQVGSALDLGTGCGVQSLHLSTHADRITATDVNPRVLKLAHLTAALNQIDVDLRKGSLYEPVEGDKFDLIVSNPPYVMSPPTGERLIYRETGFTGDGLVEEVISKSADHLNPGGVCQVLANWAVTDQPWEDRIAGWAPEGCDLWVIERERLDPYAYIEMWLTDAGLVGGPEWEAKYREWLDYFDQLGVRGIGMGWITVTNAGRTTPDITIESWPHEVQQPVGPAIAQRQTDISWAQASDDQLLSANLKLRSDIVQESLGAPGAEDPQYIVLRQHAGLKRALQIDTALGGVLGACDGTMPLGIIMDAVANLLDADPAEQRGDLLPKIRSAIAEGYFESL